MPLFIHPGAPNLISLRSAGTIAPSVERAGRDAVDQHIAFLHRVPEDQAIQPAAPVVVLGSRHAEFGAVVLVEAPADPGPGDRVSIVARSASSMPKQPRTDDASSGASTSLAA